MVKGKIRIHREFVELISEKDRRKFRGIESQASDPWNTLTYQAPHDGVILIHIPRIQQITPEHFHDLALHLRGREFIQSYVIFPTEYMSVGAAIDPYQLLEMRGVKMVYTSSLPNAISYALGILEKGAAYGIYGLQN